MSSSENVIILDGCTTETSTTPAVEAAPMKPSNESVQAGKDSVQPPLHTNSMVTIRLSDLTTMPSQECAIEDSPIEASTSEGTGQPTIDHHDVSSSGHGFQETNLNGDRESHILEAEVKLFRRAHRMSTISMPSIAEEGDSGRGPASIRSRSDSSGTLSSASSTHVDWEELDKSEQAAPRDEGSDEVSSPVLEGTSNQG